MLTRYRGRSRKASREKIRGQAFIDQYKRYYQLWLDQDGLGFSLRDAQQFVESVNKHLRTFNDEDEELDRTTINHILAGEYIPSLNQLRAMCLEFRMFGDLATASSSRLMPHAASGLKPRPGTTRKSSCLLVARIPAETSRSHPSPRW